MSYPPLPRNQQLFHDRLKAIASSFSRTSIKDIRCGCPAHGGDDPNFYTYLNPDGSIVFKCTSKECSRQDILDSLDLAESDLRPCSGGLSIQELATYKKLPAALLVEYGCEQTTYKGQDAVAIKYLDFDMKLVCQRFRPSLSEKPMQQRGVAPRCYGLWRHALAGVLGYVVLVEGESDCWTLWKHKIPAIGIPGASCVTNEVLTDLEEMARRYPDIKFYAIQETDDMGKHFVKTLSVTTLKDRIKVIRLSGAKDPSELYCQSPDDFEPRWQAALSNAVSIEEAQYSDRGLPMTSLKSSILNALRKTLSHDEKILFAERFGDFLETNDRLLIDDAVHGGGTPYVIADDDSVVRISSKVEAFKFILADCGLTPSDDKLYNRVIDHLKYRANRTGRRVTLSQYSQFDFEAQRIDISSGTRKKIVVWIEDGIVKMETRVNGENGIMFPAEHCFPEWMPDANPCDPLEFPLFNPRLEAPSEALRYEPKCQLHGLVAWLAGRVAGVRLPILLCMGAMRGGKSGTLGAINKLFVADDKEVSNVPNDNKAFATNLTSRPVYMIDNFDGAISSQLHDILALAVTGGDIDQRQYFTTSDAKTEKITAGVGVTSRTAKFAAEDDIQRRLWPLFFDQMPEKDAVSDKVLSSAISRNRSGLMTYLAEHAALALLDGKVAQGRKRDPQEFAKLVDHFADYGEESVALEQCDLAVKRCFGSSRGNQITRGIRIYFDNRLGDVLQGTSRDIADQVKVLHRDIASEIEALSATAITNMLREAAMTLKETGYSVADTPRQGQRYFVIKPI